MSKFLKNWIKKDFNCKGVFALIILKYLNNLTKEKKLIDDTFASLFGEIDKVDLNRNEAEIIVFLKKKASWILLNNAKQNKRLLKKNSDFVAENYSTGENEKMTKWEWVNSLIAKKNWENNSSKIDVALAIAKLEKKEQDFTKMVMSGYSNIQIKRHFDLTDAKFRTFQKRIFEKLRKTLKNYGKEKEI